MIIKTTGLLPGTVYPILERLERHGWITSMWENEPSRTGPRRRLYEFTAEGRVAAGSACAQFESRHPTGRPARTTKWATT
nr:helix-turn-helix transcriptional regulator [Microbacterium protaetiae]